MTISDLQALMATGEFHHATYRNRGTLWEGLWIYRKSPFGFRGFICVGSFPKDSPELIAAETICRGTGISVGAYSHG